MNLHLVNFCDREIVTVCTNFGNQRTFWLNNNILCSTMESKSCYLEFNDQKNLRLNNHSYIVFNNESNLCLNNNWYIVFNNESNSCVNNNLYLYFYAQKPFWLNMIRNHSDWVTNNMLWTTIKSGFLSYCNFLFVIEIEQLTVHILYCTYLVVICIISFYIKWLTPVWVIE